MAKAQAPHTSPAKAAVGNPGTPMPPTPNKAVAAPAGTISPAVREWVKIIAVGIAIILAVGIIASIVRGKPKATPTERDLSSGIPLASAPQSSWPKLVIPAGVKKSEFVPRPSGMKIRMAGNEFIGWAVYPDGRECSFVSSCPDGSTGAYAENKSVHANIVSYAYVPH